MEWGSRSSHGVQGQAPAGHTCQDLLYCWPWEWAPGPALRISGPRIPWEPWGKAVLPFLGSGSAGSPPSRGNLLRIRSVQRKAVCSWIQPSLKPDLLCSVKAHSGVLLDANLNGNRPDYCINDNLPLLTWGLKLEKLMSIHHTFI